MHVQWRVTDSDLATRQGLAAATDLSPLLCQVLINRGMTDAAAVQAFLTPSLHDLHDPYRLHGMERAVQRLVAAIRQGERIAIYGDYDVDGVTATALLVTFFHELGLKVPYYIPERASEGYGLNANSIRQLASQQVRLLITVDCGSTALEEVALARRLGMDIVITDHHQPPDQLPEACAILNPHQPACTYPNKHLCGVGVVFKLLTALRAALRQSPAVDRPSAQPEAPSRSRGPGNHCRCDAAAGGKSRYCALWPAGADADAQARAASAAPGEWAQLRNQPAWARWDFNWPRVSTPVVGWARRRTACSC